VEKQKLEEQLKQGQQIPTLPECIAYLLIVISVTIFLFFISDYFWLRAWTTLGAGGILELFGAGTTVTINSMTGLVTIEGFSVIKICSGIEAIALVSGLIIATPTTWKRKVGGVLFISFGIFFANMLRIVTTVVLSRQGFEPFIYHEVVSAIFTIVFIIVFILMIQAWIIPNFIDSLINILVGIVRAIKGS